MEDINTILKLVEVFISLAQLYLLLREIITRNNLK